MGHLCILRMEVFLQIGNRLIYIETWLMEAESGKFRRIILWQGDKITDIKLGDRM